MLQRKIEHFKEISRDEVADNLAQYYDEGFFSSRPIFRANDEVRINSYIEAQKSTSKTVYTESQFEEEFDDFEELIGDDEYASLINNSGEIQVGDSIYKYTETGLYYVHESDIDHLHSYLNSQPIQKVGEYDDSDDCLKVSELELIDDKITLFKDPVEGCNPDGDDGGYTPPPPTPFNIDAFIESLPECNQKKSFLSAIFGPSVSCTENYDSKHRVKTKYWNQNYLLYRSIGVAVKYQTKSTWIWWTVKTDEMKLGIYQAYFEYQLPAPNLNNIIPKIFILDGKAYDSEAQYLSTTYGKDLPNLPFEADLEIVFDLRDYGFDEYTISSEEINKFFWKTAWVEAKVVLRKLNKTMPEKISFVGLTGQTFVINYVNKSYHENDVKKITKVFDWQLVFGVKFGTNTDGGFSFKGVDLPKLYEYKKINMDIYGVARRGSVWKGSRLVYNN